jgi:hypothetical protein
MEMRIQIDMHGIGQCSVRAFPAVLASLAHTMAR